jgi:hypothetical protein
MVWMILAGWLACSVFSAGAQFAHFQGEFPSLAVRYRRQQLAEAIGFGLLFGPLSAVVAVFLTGFLEHGWRLR